MRPTNRLMNTTIYAYPESGCWKWIRKNNRKRVLGVCLNSENEHHRENLYPSTSRKTVFHFSRIVEPTELEWLNVYYGIAHLTMLYFPNIIQAKKQKHGLRVRYCLLVLAAFVRFPAYSMLGNCGCACRVQLSRILPFVQSQYSVHIITIQSSSSSESWRSFHNGTVNAHQIFRLGILWGSKQGLTTR